MEFDFDSHYSVDGYGGIAWYVIGYATQWTEESWTFLGDDNDDRDDESLYAYDEPEEYEDREHVRAVMVGDDRVFEFEIDELTPISEDDYCPECGQIGCKAYG
jgi:hypothetical protein